MSKEAIGNLSRTKAIMQKYHLHAKKGFGQNFLTNPAVLNGIVDAAAISSTDNVIEIGPAGGTDGKIGSAGRPGRSLGVGHGLIAGID